MVETTIRVENLGKRYRIGSAGQRHDTLRDAVVAGVRGRAARLKRRVAAPGSAGPDAEVFWALKGVSFEVARGEVLGVIGRNGAGKSTLLKILSRITEPTEGRAEISGRVGSLLEVGTGFHPELTGRENVFLNGAILGMRRAEIQRRFDDIVDFAEVGKFLDTPVKRYSSGMYVRLAFAVAAHLEPEILLVDEVLAVGDATFQRKCLGKMGDVAQEGRTVLFVSHNMSSIERLCSKSILLDTGTIAAYDRTAAVIGQYMSGDLSVSEPGRWIELTGSSRTGSGRAMFVRAYYSGAPAAGSAQPVSDGPLDVELEVFSDAPRSVGSLAVTLYDAHGLKLVNAETMTLGQHVELKAGLNRLRLRIQALHLSPGAYNVGLWLAHPGSEVLDHVGGAFRIQVASPEEHGFGVRPSHDGLVTCEFGVVVEP